MKIQIKLWFIIITAFLPISLTAQTIITLTDEIRTYTSLINTTVNMYGRSELHITDKTNPVSGSQINLYSEDAWLFFDYIKPSLVIAKYLNQIKVFDQDADIHKNVRVVIYLNGTVVIPHSPNYKPLTVYEDSLYGGASLELGIYSYHKASSSLSSMNDKISSFKLKRGYMATFAQNDNGTGYSKVYIAQDGDINIELLPRELNDQVSFIRVLPWIWINKKGFCGDKISSADSLNCSWYYDWGSTTPLTANVEFVPMHWGYYASNVNGRNDVTHALGFNEPDKQDQANLSVKQAISMWPDLLKSGLRLGSPAPSDASSGLNWLYSFIDKADSLNYRVDFVCVHYYKGCWTASQFYSWLKAIHERTGRPIWVTEWNNGANWTGCEPTYEQQAQAIKEIITMLDTAKFVERYSIYNWVGNTRAVISNFNPFTLTQAGIIYKENQSPMAYYDPRSVPKAPSNLIANATSSIQIDLSWADNSDNETGFKIERKTKETPFTQIAKVGANVTHYTDKNLSSSTEYFYRVVAYNSIGDSYYSNIASDTTLAGLSILPQKGWKLHYVDSQELVGENGAATNAFDGNINTFWHTQWYNSSPPYPHEIQINLGKVYSIAGLIYLPRQDGNINGTIADYEIYISVDGSNWGYPVAKGRWANNSNQKEVYFNAVEGQYVRLLAKSEVNGNNWASAAEINILVEGNITSINEDLKVDKTFSLNQNYPDPFNLSTIISYSIPNDSRVTLKVFDILGREIATLVNEEKKAGTYSVSFNGNDFSSGIYFYSLRTNYGLITKKMLLIK